MAEFRKLPCLEDLSLSCKHEDRGPSGAPIWNREKYAIRDDALETFPDFPRLRRLYLSFTQITDRGVAILSRLTQLESLELNSPRITSESAPDLTKLQNLKSLGLSACAIDERSVAALSAFPKLTWLRISGTGIGNECLPQIAKLQNLNSLYLGGKIIDDNGLPYLHGMKNLASLDLASTGVTTDGPAVKELKKALPNCSIRQHYPSISFR